jgi:membrane protein implicated in regulation of membrane protease activity
MIIIGFALLVVGLAAGADVMAQNHGGSVRVHAIGHVWATTPAMLVAVGAVAALVAVVGVLLLRDGLSRRRRINQEVRDTARQRDELAARVTEEHRARLAAVQASAAAQEDADRRMAVAVAQSDAARQAADAVEPPVVSGPADSQLADLRDTGAASKA